MKENILSKYYFYAITLFTYLILAFKNIFTKKKKTVHYLVAPQTIKDMYDRYGFINLTRVAIRAPKNLNFSTTGITLFRNVYLPDAKKNSIINFCRSYKQLSI